MSTDLIFHRVDVPKTLNVMMFQKDSFFMDQDVNRKLMQYKCNNETIKASLQKVEMTLKCRNNFLPVNTWRTSLSNWFAVEAHGKWEK